MYIIYIHIHRYQNSQGNNGNKIFLVPHLVLLFFSGTNSPLMTSLYSFHRPSHINMASQPGPPCTFSRAVTPAVRSRLKPEGLSNLTVTMEKKVAIGNQHAKFVLSMVLLCKALGLAYWVENPDGSFLWLLPQWVEAEVADFAHSYRFDMCRFGTPWRKRTRVCISTDLQGVRELCLGDHKHLPLRGRSTSHAMCWTRVAQTYPAALCWRIATVPYEK